MREYNRTENTLKAKIKLQKGTGILRANDIINAVCKQKRFKNYSCFVLYERYTNSVKIITNGVLDIHIIANLAIALKEEELRIRLNHPE